MTEKESFVVMLVTSGHGPDSQWFDYRPSFFANPVRVEWEKDTKNVALPEDVASFLVKGGYAREMTEREAEEYTSPPPPLPDQKKTQEPPPQAEVAPEQESPPSPPREEATQGPASRRDKSKKGATQ